jgi:hypothetical protein
MNRIALAAVVILFSSTVVVGQESPQSNGASGLSQARSCQGVKLSPGDPEYQQIQEAYDTIHKLLLSRDVAPIKDLVSSGADPIKSIMSDSDLQLVPQDYKIAFIVLLPSEGVAWIRMTGNVTIRVLYSINRKNRNPGDTVNVESELFFLKENGQWKLAAGSWDDPAGLGNTLARPDSRIAMSRHHLLESRTCYPLIDQLYSQSP